jgi:exonuclease SbcD
MKIIHTADIHIGVENYGKTDMNSRLSTRLIDFLDRFDEMVDYSIKISADIVLICGDAYKNRNPNQTHQREFAKRIVKLSKHKIPVFLLAGNHDSPNIPGPATSLEIFPLLNLPNVYTGDSLKTHLIHTQNGPLQIISVPWIRKGDFISEHEWQNLTIEQSNAEIQKRLIDQINKNALGLNPNFPAILTGHLSTESAVTSSEKSMMLSKDYLIPTKALALPQLDYIALGHIHRHQVLNNNPKVVYSGSLERIDFGEENDRKGFCLIEIDPAKKQGFREINWEFIAVNARRFITIKILISDTDIDPTKTIVSELSKHDTNNAIVQLIIETPSRLYDEIIDSEIRSNLYNAHIIAAIKKHIITEKPSRLGKSMSETITPIEALVAYLNDRNLGKQKTDQLLNKGKELIIENPNSIDN